MEAFKLYFDTLLNDSGNLILLFFITGIVFNVFGEIIKKQIFPVYTAEELAAGKKQKEMPRWVGMIFGIIMTLVFLACALGAYFTGVPHCRLIGGVWFLPVWCVAYYVWQLGCMKLVKMILRALFPCFMTGHKPYKPPKPKYVKVPVEYAETIPEGAQETQQDTDV